MLTEIYPLGFNITGMCSGTARPESAGAIKEREHVVNINSKNRSG
jgi:hypothetical protein